MNIAYEYLVEAQPTPMSRKELQKLGDDGWQLIQVLAYSYNLYWHYFIRTMRGE